MPKGDNVASSGNVFADPGRPRAAEAHAKVELSKKIIDAIRARRLTPPLRKEKCRRRFREESRPALLRMLAELLLPARKSDGSRQGGGRWER
jgi:hypothetical protein